MTAKGTTRGNRSRYQYVTETEWQQQIFDLLRLNGWKVAHFRAAMVGKRMMTPVQADGKGWPDLFCVHPPTGDCIAVELKMEYSSPTPEQAQWLTWLELCGIESVVWKPSMVDAVIVRLRKPRDRSRPIEPAR